MMKVRISVALLLGLCLFVSAGQAQVNDVGPSAATKITSVAANRDVGDELFFVDLETPCGENLLLGVGWDGSSYWVTGALDFYTARLYEFDSSWNLMNTFVTGHSSWGWRDLSFDGSFLYASDSYVIDQIDRTTGTGTGVTIASPVSPARAQAYDPATDSFWTASWSSDIYNVQRDGTYVSYANILGGVYGMGWDDSDPAAPMLWIWSQDGSSLAQATQFDPLTGTFTGESFQGNGALGMAGGADVFVHGTHGLMVLGMHQGAPDGAAGYSLVDDPTPQIDLKVNGGDEDVVIAAGNNGTITLDIEARGHAGVDVDVFVGVMHLGTGLMFSHDSLDFVPWMPGLPPVYFTGALSDMSVTLWDAPIPALGSFYLKGCIDEIANGMLDIGPNIVAYDSVNFRVTSEYHGTYMYDDGSTENLLGWYSAGDMCWMQKFDTGMGGSPIIDVQTIFGSALYTGYGPGDGYPAMLYVWDDPTNDGDPTDIVLVSSESVVTQNYDTDIMNIYPLTTPAAVSGEFYVGVMLEQEAGWYVIPMDQDTAYTWGTAYYCGNPGAPGTFDPNVITNNIVWPSEYGVHWCERAGF